MRYVFFIFYVWVTDFYKNQFEVKFLQFCQNYEDPAQWVASIERIFGILPPQQVTTNLELPLRLPVTSELDHIALESRPQQMSSILPRLHDQPERLPQQLPDHIALESQPPLIVQPERLPQQLSHKRRHRIRHKTVPAKDPHQTVNAKSVRHASVRNVHQAPKKRGSTYKKYNRECHIKPTINAADVDDDIIDPDVSDDPTEVTQYNVDIACANSVLNVHSYNELCLLLGNNQLAADLVDGKVSSIALTISEKNEAVFTAIHRGNDDLDVPVCHSYTERLRVLMVHAYYIFTFVESFLRDGFKNWQKTHIISAEI